MITQFVIVGTQRTGTTWIRTTLDNHPAIHAHGEVFLYSNGRFPLFRTTGFDVPNSYGSYVAATLRRRLMHFTNRRKLVQDFLDRLYDGADAEAVGFKFMCSQSRQFPGVLQYIRDRRIKIVHVVRQNVLKTYISRKTAKRRKLAHSIRSVPVERIAIRTRGLIEQLDRISGDNRSWERACSTLPYLKLVYEEFVRDKPAQLNRLYSFLSVEPIPHAPSALVKLNPHAIRDIVTNFEDVSRALQGTFYEWCLSE